MLKFFNFKTNKTYLIFVLISINIFILPIVLYGINDLEEYQLGYFTLKTYINFPLSFLYEYVDFYGPGVKLPIGHFPILHPSNIFLFNTQLHFFFYYFINLTVQFIFFKKIFKLIFRKNHYIIFFIIFSISNFNYSYSDDWPGAHFNFTIFFPSFYYWLKFLKKGNDLSFYKFIFFISFGFLNGHLGSLINHYFFLILFTLFNGYFFFLKEKRLYIGIIFITLISSPVLFHLVNEYFMFDKNVLPATQPNYKFNEFLYSFLNPFVNIEWPINRRPYYGIIIPIALLISLINIQNSKDSKKIFYVDKIFLLFTLLSLTSLTKYLYLISAVWTFRDIYNILSIIIIYNFLKNKKNYLNFIIFVQLIYVLIFFYFNLSYLDNNKNNFIKNSKNNLNLFENKNEFHNKQYYKTFLSPLVNKKIRNEFKESGNYAVTDLIFKKYSPFNGWFKNYSVDDFQTSKVKMHGRIDGSYEDLNNTNFLKNFLIGEIIFLESEINEFNVDNFFVYKKEVLLNDTILFAKIIEKGFPILLNLDFDYSICEENINKIKCLTQKNTNLSDIKIEKLGFNKFIFLNKTDKDVNFIFPFSDFYNWYSNEVSIEKDKNFKKLGILKLKPKQKVIFEYKDYFRASLKIISLLTMIILLTYLIKIYKKN